MVERDIQSFFPRSKRYIAMPPVDFVLYIWWARRSRPLDTYDGIREIQYYMYVPTSPPSFKKSRKKRKKGKYNIRIK